MDPLTLASEGCTDFGGKMQGETFCAHPKIDPLTGNMCAYGKSNSTVPAAVPLGSS